MKMVSQEIKLLNHSISFQLPRQTVRPVEMWCAGAECRDVAAHSTPDPAGYKVARRICNVRFVFAGVSNTFNNEKANKKFIKRLQDTVQCRWSLKRLQDTVCISAA